MKLIIDINDNEYIGIKEYPDNVTSYPVTIHLYDAVKNGIPLPTEIQALQQIRDIVNSPVYIQEDVLRYQMICDVLNMADSEVNK